MLRQHQAKRRRSRSHHAPKQKQSIPYNAPSDLSSDLVVSSVLRDVATTASACALHTAQSAAGSEAEGGVARSTDFEVIDHGSQDAECSICLSKLDEKPATVIKMCNHVFHEDCILDWIGRSTADDPSCPLCQRSIPVERRGRSPTGTMTIQLSSSFCPGFPSGTTCIELIYDIPSGQQLPFHDNPGTWYKGTCRKAYLPDTDDGRRLLCRLKYAFARGHAFAVGTSLTTGKQNAVVWNVALDHKTSLCGGLHGFPDLNYLSRCHSQLDRLGVPDNSRCCNGPHRGASFRNHQVVPYIAPQTLLPCVPVPGTLVPIISLPSSQSVARNDRVPAITVTPSLLPTAPLCRAPADCVHNSPPQPLPSAPTQVDSTPCADEFCSICLEPLSLECAAEVIVCQHIFHRSCIASSLDHNPRCPVCRTRVSEPRGRSPSGTLTIRSLNSDCPGFGKSKVIELVYNIPSGIQRAYHDHPGTPFAGTNRTAYLPNNEEGCHLLTRLKYAWNRGLIFTVGTSLTTQQRNVVTWASIPHKTSLQRGGTAYGAQSNPHAFPDPNYLTNCHDTLDAHGVPDADTCLSMLS